MNKSKNITIPICLILLIQVMLCCSSCSKREKHQIDLHYLNNLADTVYTGQERMVFLTNGVGGWYFDDAFKSKTRGTFGYNRKEEKVLSNWELLDLEGNSLLDDPLFCVTFPTHIERHYSNEIIERIEMPLGNSGISFEFILPKRQGVIFRPYFDFRHLEYEESVDYITLLDDNSGTLCAAKEDMSGGWVAVSSSAPFEWRETIKIQRQNYSLSELTGRPGSAIPWSPGEVSTKPGRKVQFAVGWGKDKVTAINTSNTIVSSVLIWRENRVSRIKDVLDDVVFSCDNRDLVKAFDWARIVANQFVYEENERINIFTGFPYTPFPTGWGTFLSISEMLKCGISSNDITEIIESTIEGQKQDKYSPKYGMLPSSIKDGENEYLVSEIAGLMVRALMKLKNQDVPDRFRITETMISATKANLIGTAIYRVKNGMVVSDSLEHFLADSPGAPLRGGAAIENQVLYSICREFFKDRNIIPDTSDFLKDIPGSLLKGVGLEAFNSDAPFIVVGETSKYSLVLRKKLVLSPFTDNSSTWFGDYVP
ncbi:hypothetical protein H8D57_03825, partial [bacterium]|nr:hypothetical protein [bacterium]